MRKDALINRVDFEAGYLCPDNPKDLKIGIDGDNVAYKAAIMASRPQI